MLRPVRFWIAAAFVIVNGSNGPAWSQQQPSLSAAQIKKIKASGIDEQSLARLQKVFPELANAGQAQGVPSPAKQQVLTKAPNHASLVAQPSPPAPSSAFQILIRNDWSDLGILGACGATSPSPDNGGSDSSPEKTPGVSTDSAKGATLSFTQDYAAKNRIWAAQGMAAAVFSDCNPNLVEGKTAGLLEKSIAVYAQVNSDYNSNATLASKNNVDTRTAGVSGEIVYQTLSGDLQVFRLTPNVVRDDIKNTTAVAVMGQYVPALISLPGVWVPHGLLNTSILYQFNPTLDVQYASTTDRKKPLQFSGMSQSLRIGPELALIVTPFAGGGNDFLSRISINELFHPWYETYSERGSYWWTNTIKYNLDQSGNFALALSYNRGKDENSGVMTNQYVLSLNGKI
jgi:hypothetical protein